MKWKNLGYDVKILHEVLEGFLPRQRREWYVKIKLSQFRLNFHELAEKIKTQSWYLSAQVCGGYYLKGGWINSNMNPKAVDAVQEVLMIDLLPFLNPTEIKRYFTAFPDRITPQYAERLIKPNRKMLEGGGNRK